MAAGVYRSFPNQYPLRLSDEQIDRVQRRASKKSKKLSDYMRDAVMRQVIEDEVEERARSQAIREEKERTFVPRNVRPSAGLGIDFTPKVEVSVPVESLSPAIPSTVVIQNSVSSTSVDLLADYVLAARNTVDVEERKRVVTNVLLAHPSLEEQRRLAKELDDRVAEKKKEREKTKPPDTARAGWGLLSASRRG